MIERFLAQTTFTSEEDFKEFLQADDDMVELEDKLAVIAEFADTHDDIGGIAIIGFGRK